MIELIQARHARSSGRARGGVLTPAAVAFVGRFDEARTLFTQAATFDELEEFLTLPAYDILLD